MVIWLCELSAKEMLLHIKLCAYERTIYMPASSLILNSCWLSADEHTIFFFVAPAAAIIIVSDIYWWIIATCVSMLQDAWLPYLRHLSLDKLHIFTLCCFCSAEKQENPTIQEGGGDWQQVGVGKVHSQFVAIMLNVCKQIITHSSCKQLINESLWHVPQPVAVQGPLKDMYRLPSVVVSLNMYRVTMRAVVTLLPLLGLTWIFGVLTLNRNTTVFAWFFTLFNSLQVRCDQSSRGFGVVW